MAKYVLYHVPFPIYSQWLTLAISDSERKSATTTSMVSAMAKESRNWQEVLSIIMDNTVLCQTDVLF